MFTAVGLFITAFTVDLLFTTVLLAGWLRTEVVSAVLSFTTVVSAGWVFLSTMLSIVWDKAFALHARSLFCATLSFRSVKVPLLFVDRIPAVLIVGNILITSLVSSWLKRIDASWSMGC